jgi:hypothetical protein
MRSDSQASFLAGNLASPCFGRKPKAQVVTISDNLLVINDLFVVDYQIPIEMVTLSKEIKYAN